MAKQNWKAKQSRTVVKTRSTRRWSDEAARRTRDTIRLLVPLVLFAGVVFLFFALIRWLNPLPTSRLIVVTARNDVEVLSPNVAAVADARALLQLPEVFELADADISPANLEQFQAQIRGIENHRPNRLTLFPWQPSRTVVYVNATGVALPQPDAEPDEQTLIPWLVPDGFDPDEDPTAQLIPVSSIVRALADSRASQKLLVLDCQKPGVHPYFGTRTGRFVEAVKDLLESLDRSETRGLFVLLSSRPGEDSWPMHPGGGSVFGNFFLRGVSGEAEPTGKRNERVNLAELYTYLDEQMQRWATDFCLARQRPMLFDFGQATDSFEVTVSRTSKRVPAPGLGAGSISRSQNSAELEQAWTRYAEFSVRAAAPWEWAPVQWNVIQDQLILADRLYQQGDYESSSRTLQRLQSGLAALLDSHRAVVRLMRANAPAPADFLMECCARDWNEIRGSPLAIGPFDDLQGLPDQVIDDPAAMTTVMDRLNEVAAEQASPLPPTLHFLRLIDRELAADRPNGTLDDHERLKQIVQLRQRAEQVATPQSPQIGPWLTRLLLRADAQRRIREDAFLLASGQPLPVGEHPPEPAASKTGFDNLETTKQTLTAAYEMRNRLLAELPSWIAFLARSEQLLVDMFPEEGAAADDATVEEDGSAQVAGTKFPLLAAQKVRHLIGGLEDLTLQLLVQPASLTDGQLQQQIDQVALTLADLELQLNQLHRGRARYAIDLAQPRLWPSNAATWRRIDAALVLPYLTLGAGRTDQVTPEAAARLRLQLIDRLNERVSKADEQDKPADAEQRSEHGQFIAQLFWRLRRLPFLDDAPDVTDLVDDEQENSTSWQQVLELVDTATNSGAEVDELQRADIAFRLLPRDLGTDLAVFSPTILLRTQLLADWLLVQADRAADDFYGSVDENTAPYSQNLAGEYVDAALRLANAKELLRAFSAGTDRSDSPTPQLEAGLQPDLDRLRNKLSGYQSLLQTTGLVGRPPEVVFRATDYAPLKLNVRHREQFPSGTAAVHTVPPQRPVGTAGPDGVGVLVTRPELEKPDQRMSLATTLTFRGHRFRGTFPMAVVDELAGATIAYRKQNAGPGRLLLRSRQVSNDPLRLLFILDCSRSMAFAGESGQPRIADLKQVLRHFAAFAESGNVQVGIRVFGHRVADINAAEAHTDTERLLPIGPFNRTRLEKVLPAIVPRGHSPIFNALLQARDDFGNVTEGRREIVLISDGADNWALAGQKPGIDELTQAFQGSGIRINAIGYDVERFADYVQLKEIARASAPVGRCVTVATAESMLQELAGLAGLPGFRVSQRGETIHEEPHFAAGARAVELPAGTYDVEILAPGKSVLASRSIRVLPAELHELVYDSASLEYASPPQERAVRFVAGTDKRPDLAVLETQLLGNQLVVDFGLHSSATFSGDLLPVSAAITAVQDNEPGESWYAAQLPPNVDSEGFPAWRIAIDDWPAAADAFQLRVSWNQLPTRRIPVSLDWNRKFDTRTVADNVLLTRREQQTRRIDDVDMSLVTLTFVLETASPGIELWSCIPQSSIAFARNTYNVEQGIFTTRFAMPDGKPPASVLLQQSEPASPERTIQVLVPLDAERINR
ncbi:hypothetical protein Mal4_56040 [Maioricimonas rarisocia]|uniref:VWFA domain-containing protein n=1 Tax=Maioricimonas rarisocia TaxID=2528026 RepID=A0A517ZFM2_9PLAN|nr:vWA domain-containing protein [Maioricimonas rarisocia]QDU41239.1 hypothetical protein Mal4_56040 [Maioricimonas rarisocia]